MIFPLPSSYAGLPFPEFHLFYLDLLLHFTISYYTTSSDFPEKMMHKRKLEALYSEKNVFILPSSLINGSSGYINTGLKSFSLKILKVFLHFPFVFSVTTATSVPI